MNSISSDVIKYYRHLTPLGEGGISSFLIYGQDNSEFIKSYFKNFNGTIPTREFNRFYYGKLFNQQDQLIDEIILCLKDNSTIEFHSHGGFSSTREILKFLESINFQKMPVLVYQQINLFYHYEQALLEVNTPKEFEFLHTQIKNYQQSKSIIENENTQEQIDLLHTMVREWKIEKNNRRRVSICLAGLPNAGKSSLINSITGKKRALVSSIAKTTRDTLTENVQIHGYRFQIMDTAGLHNPDNYLDQESVKQSLANIERAEIIFWLHDNATEFSKEELTFLDLIKNKCQDKPIWLILTKADIPLQINHQVSNAIFQNSHLISTISGAGLELLLLDLTKFLFPQRQEPLPLAAVSEQMSLEIVDFLQKVDLLTAKHKMVKVFMAQILNCISKIGNTENGYK